jgi:hypothetical protein
VCEAASYCKSTTTKNESVYEAATVGFWLGAIPHRCNRAASLPSVAFDAADPIDRNSLTATNGRSDFPLPDSSRDPDAFENERKLDSGASLAAKPIAAAVTAVAAEGIAPHE